MRSLRVATNPATKFPTAAADAAIAGRGGETARVRGEIEALERLGLDELRLRWRNRWGRLAPAHLSRTFLFRLMAYRLQAEALGDLDRQTAAMLSKMAKDAAGHPSAQADAEANASPAPAISASRAERSGPPRVLKPGAIMTREWRGRIERVMALEDGFAWNGKRYASLSGVAVAITGVKWSGHRFFFGGDGRNGGGDDRNGGGAGGKPGGTGKPHRTAGYTAAGRAERGARGPGASAMVEVAP
jgi:Protein of unknown function (DUF2924)